MVHHCFLAYCCLRIKHYVRCLRYGVRRISTFNSYTMSYIINYPDLQLGDIILDRNNSHESEVIRKRSKSDYSHARLYVGGTLIESEGAGVQSVNPQRLLYDNPDDFIVLRPQWATEEQKQMACLFARSEVGKEYGGKDVKKSQSKPDVIGEPNRQFCTRLVAQAYKYAGYPIVGNADYCTPSEIQSSPYLDVIGDMWHEATNKEIEIANQDGVMRMQDETNRQNEIYVTMLQDIRNAINDADCDIQTEKEMLEYLIAHTEYDEVFTQIFRNSEYFTLWLTYEQETPEEYDAKLFIDKYGAEAKHVALNYLCTPQNHVSVWKCQLDIYTRLSEIYGLKLFQAFKELYTNILASHQRRISTFHAILTYSL